MIFFGLTLILLRSFWVTMTRKNFAKKEKITNKNRYHCTAPTPGAVFRPSHGAKCKNKPNKANKPLLPLFRSLGSQSINQRAKHRHKANKPPKITNHYENKNQ